MLEVLPEGVRMRDNQIALCSGGSRFEPLPTLVQPFQPETHALGVDPDALEEEPGSADEVSERLVGDDALGDEDIMGRVLVGL